MLAPCLITSKNMWATKSLLCITLALILSACLAEEKKDEGYKTPKEKRLQKEFQGFLDTEQKLIDSIRKYIDLEKERLAKLKTLAENASELKVDYIYNPVNVFKLIKRLVYSDVFAGMHENSADDVVGSFRDELPSEESLRKAAIEVFKFQDKEDSKVKDLANGDLPNGKQIKPLNIDDCFHLGRMAYNDEDFYHAALWMEEAWERVLLKKDKAEPKDKVPILDYLAFCYYKMDNLQRAHWMTKHLMLKIDPSNQRAKDNIGYYETELKEAKLEVIDDEAKLPAIKYMTAKDLKKAEKEKDKKAKKEAEAKKDDKKKDAKKDDKKDKKKKDKKKKDDKKDEL